MFFSKLIVVDGVQCLTEHLSVTFNSKKKSQILQAWMAREVETVESDANEPHSACSVWSNLASACLCNDTEIRLFSHFSSFVATARHLRTKQSHQRAERERLMERLFTLVRFVPEVFACLDNRHKARQRPGRGLTRRVKRRCSSYLALAPRTLPQRSVWAPLSGDEWKTFVIASCRWEFKRASFIHRVIIVHHRSCAPD